MNHTQQGLRLGASTTSSAVAPESTAVPDKQTLSPRVTGSPMLSSKKKKSRQTNPPDTLPPAPTGSSSRRGGGMDRSSDPILPPPQKPQKQQEKTPRLSLAPPQLNSVEDMEIDDPATVDENAQTTSQPMDVELPVRPSQTDNPNQGPIDPGDIGLIRKLRRAERQSTFLASAQAAAQRGEKPTSACKACGEMHWSFQCTKPPTKPPQNGDSSRKRSATTTSTKDEPTRKSRSRTTSGQASRASSAHPSSRETSVPPHRPVAFASSKARLSQKQLEKHQRSAEIDEILRSGFKAFLPWAPAPNPEAVLPEVAAGIAKVLPGSMPTELTPHGSGFVLTFTSEPALTAAIGCSVSSGTYKYVITKLHVNDSRVFALSGLSHLGVQGAIYGLNNLLRPDQRYHLRQVTVLNMALPVCLVYFPEAPGIKDANVVVQALRDGEAGRVAAWTGKMTIFSTLPVCNWCKCSHPAEQTCPSTRPVVLEDPSGRLLPNNPLE